MRMPRKNIDVFVGILFCSTNRMVRLLTETGQYETVEASKLGAKRLSNHVVAYDFERNEIRAKSSFVVIVAGQHRGKGGRVEHIWKGHVFVKAGRHVLFSLY